jgi:hypothetical protein
MDNRLDGTVVTAFVDIAALAGRQQVEPFQHPRFVPMLGKKMLHFHVLAFFVDVALAIAAFVEGKRQQFPLDVGFFPRRFGFVSRNSAVRAACTSGVNSGGQGRGVSRIMVFRQA